MRARYNHKNCQSLFGYAFDVHLRSGGTCQLCGCGGPSLTFDLWRQLTVEHIVGKRQGGYLKDIGIIVGEIFSTRSQSEQEALAKQIDAANTVTACSFCNSTTSQHSSGVAMRELIQDAANDQDSFLPRLTRSLQRVLDEKRADVQWKMESVRQQYDANVAPKLKQAVQGAG